MKGTIKRTIGSVVLSISSGSTDIEFGDTPGFSVLVKDKNGNAFPAPGAFNSLTPGILAVDPVTGLATTVSLGDWEVSWVDSTGKVWL